MGEWLWPLLGAIAGCHCSVLGGGESGRAAIAGAIVVCFVGGEGDDQLWVLLEGAIAVPLQGAMVVCYGGGRGGWGSGRGAIGGCHCSVVWSGDQLWGSGRSIAGCPHPTQQWHPEKPARKAVLSFLQTLHCSLH